MAIVRFNPARDLLNVEREFNRLFRTFEDRFGLSSRRDIDEEYENAMWTPLADISEDKNNYTIQLDLPGVKKEDLKISCTEGTLSISGERKEEKISDATKYHRVERNYGKYYRTFNLPQSIQQDRINAEFKDGQLKITIPKKEEARPKEIEIK
jgi:HSP20 family protein